MIGADELWDMGYSGQKIIVANMDTGVDLKHPDLTHKWRGGNNSWYDPHGQHKSPFDKDGHGTQTMGIIVGGDTEETTIGVALQLNISDLLLAGIALGGMAFLNTWDFPFYVALYAGAYALGRVRVDGIRISAAVMHFTWMGLILGSTGVVLYLPFYLGFSSQAGGILPNLIYPTRGTHLWAMFAPLLIPNLS